jgi:hypothetical protein
VLIITPFVPRQVGEIARAARLHAGPLLREE